MKFSRLITPWDPGRALLPLARVFPLLLHLPQAYRQPMKLRKDLYPLAPEDTCVYHLRKDSEPENLLSLDQGLTGDTLIEFFNAVSATFDRMRNFEDDFEQEETIPWSSEEEDRP